MINTAPENRRTSRVVNLNSILNSSGKAIVSPVIEAYPAIITSSLIQPHVPVISATADMYMPPENM